MKKGNPNVDDDMERLSAIKRIVTQFNVIQLSPD